MEFVKLCFEHPWWTTLWLSIICCSIPTVVLFGKKK